MWGLDLSGSLQGAGGVGGLLAVNDVVNGTNFVAYDGNGNVAALVNATDGTETARYEYGPFGEVIRATGPMAKANPFRFSTKYQDEETDQLYYGYRFYNPSHGRWLSRDPIGEGGGLNLYGFVGNDSIEGFDPFGLENYNWGKLGAFEMRKDLHEGEWYDRWMIVGRWFEKLPGDGKTCCEKPVIFNGRRSDTGNKGIGLGINMSIKLSFSGGPYKELLVVWETCYLRADHTVQVRMPCNNSTTCYLPSPILSRFYEEYNTSAQVRFLSCEGGKWTTMKHGLDRDYGAHGKW